MKAKLQSGKSPPRVRFETLNDDDWFVDPDYPADVRVKVRVGNNNTLVVCASGSLIAVTTSSSDLVTPVQATISY